MARSRRQQKEEKDILIINEPDLSEEITNEKINEEVQEELDVSELNVAKVDKKVKETKTKSQSLSEFLY